MSGPIRVRLGICAVDHEAGTAEYDDRGVTRFTLPLAEIGVPVPTHLDLDITPRVILPAGVQLTQGADDAAAR